ncbi:MAG: hypothetical protein DIU78_006610 [Pseudomonadota bacterium]|nr:MAG: hypothetical protein DIU78_10265 [Pseudomonadota bacterium]
MAIDDALVAELASFTGELLHTHPLIARARRGQISPSVVNDYLTSILHLLRSTPRLLDEAERRARERGELLLARFFARKANEERGHEHWAEHDIATLRSAYDLPPGQPRKAIIELVTWLERLVDTDPGSYVGYVFFAEYFTVLAGPECVRTLTEFCGIPRDALTAVSHHVELDQAHVAEARIDIRRLFQGKADAEARLLDALRASECYFRKFVDELDRCAAAAEARCSTQSLPN